MGCFLIVMPGIIIIKWILSPEEMFSIQKEDVNKRQHRMVSTQNKPQYQNLSTWNKSNFVPGRQLLVLWFVPGRHCLVHRFFPGRHLLVQTVARNFQKNSLLMGETEFLKIYFMFSVVT